MLQIPIGQAMSAAGKITSFSQLLSSHDASASSGVGLRFPEEQFNWIRTAAKDFASACEGLGLHVSADIARDLVVEHGRLPVEDGIVVIEGQLLRRCKALHDAINQCFQREAKANVAIVLSAEKLKMFDCDMPAFGSEVQAKFPSLVYEIEEASKCLALSRTTAGAFHAIRSLEGGITAISRSLGIQDPTKGAERNWGSMLTKIKAEIDRRWVGSASRMSGDGATFEGLYGVLAALQNPYRNATMHFDQKYTEEEARHIFELVKGVLQKIACRMDQDGLPLVPNL